MLLLTASPSALDEGPPAPPTGWQHALSKILFRALSPRLKRVALPDTPQRMEPFETVRIPRRHAVGQLSGTFFPALPDAASKGAGRPARALGAVLMGHPWMEWGQTYFHRRGRIEALRRLGYGVLTFDLGGFGASDRTVGFYHHDVADALEWLGARVPEGPLHCWGVSSGGYWMHPVLAAREDAGRRVVGAFFEDVSPHLIEWSGRTAPAGRPFYAVFRHITPGAYRFLDLRRHAPFLGLKAVAYVVGAEDAGIPEGEARELAHRAGGELLLVPAARHLGSIKRAQHEVLALAVETFSRAEDLAADEVTTS